MRPSCDISLLFAILTKLQEISAADFLHAYHLGASAGVYPQELNSIVDMLEDSLITRLDAGEDMDAVQSELGVIGLIFLTMFEREQYPEQCTLSTDQNNRVRKLFDNSEN